MPKRREREESIKRERQAVVIVDRNLLFRAGLVHALTRDSFQVFSERSSIDEVPFGDLAAGQPILLLIGLDTARIGAMQGALLNLRRLYDDLHIVIFYDHDPMYPLPPEISEIGKLADALLPKDEIDSDALTKAVDLVLLGAWVVSKELLRLMASTNGHAALESALVTSEPEVDALPERTRKIDRPGKAGPVASYEGRLEQGHRARGRDHRIDGQDPRAERHAEDRRQEPDASGDVGLQISRMICAG
jgi:DNA-binding NarL/FixJ family response regulator